MGGGKARTDQRVFYLGKSDRFDKAIAAFSIAYADQNEKDHAALKRALHDDVKAVIEKEK